MKLRSKLFEWELLEQLEVLLQEVQKFVPCFPELGPPIVMKKKRQHSELTAKTTFKPTQKVKLTEVRKQVRKETVRNCFAYLESSSERVIQKILENIHNVYCKLGGGAKKQGA
jgi:hypothetical protein